MTRDPAEMLKGLRPFIEKISTAKLRKDNQFRLSLLSSLRKSFETVDLAFDEKNHNNSLYQAAALRSTCEEIIFLKFASTLTRKVREEFIRFHLTIEIAERLQHQKKFFSTFRPTQPVLAATIDIEVAKKGMREIWMKNGWPNLSDKKYVPPTRDIAQKLEHGFLAILYDYIFRATSSFVHFSPHILLRFGWGDLNGKMTFTPSNMNSYYLAFSQVYGLFLFSLYFELFPTILKPDTEARSVVREMRTWLVKLARWPEVVTFEEMNLARPPSNIFHPISLDIQSEATKHGLLKGLHAFNQSTAETKRRCRSSTT